MELELINFGEDMAEDIRLSLGFFGHVKTKKLCKKCGEHAVLALLKLWVYAAQNHPDGVLRGMDADDIEMAVDWSGEDGCFLKTISEIGWLEQEDDGTFIIHGWQEKQSWVAGEKDRSDEGRFNRLRQINKAVATICDEFGLTGVDKTLYGKIKNIKSEEKAREEIQGYLGHTLGTPQGTPRGNPGVSPAPAPAPAPAPVPAPTLYSDKLVEFVEVFQGYIVQQHGNKAPRITASKTRSDTETVDKLIRLDGFEFEKIKDVLRWALRDDFWQDQVLSLSALRRKKDGLTKFQKLAAAYDRDHRAAKVKSKSMSKEEQDAMVARVEEKMKGKNNAGLRKLTIAHD